MEYRVLDSLHRPFHRPLWIVKWTCYFVTQRYKSPDGYIYSKEKTTDFYFCLLKWMHENYPQDSDGIPSKESIEECWNYFNQTENSCRETILKEILTKDREKGVETKIYSTYKAASYYLNLADDKLHFINEQGDKCCWRENQLTKAVLKSGVSNTDRIRYFDQILEYDGQFFLSMCLLQKPTRKYDLKIEDEIFKFMQKYYPTPNFDYTRQSHSNYYVVRKRWVELLKALNKNGGMSRALMNYINENSTAHEIYKNVAENVKSYTIELRQRGEFLKQKREFTNIYKKLASKSEDKSNFVNLYDISKEMRMSYQRFQAFLSKFYQEERMVRNIFFVNIVSTIEQRKRFYIGNSPVMKIKMTKYYGA